jgi:lipoate-protein ligase A
MTIVESVACRLLPFITASGAWQMAADEVMLEAAATSGVASFRVYAWTTATLTLGYFQPGASRLTDPLLAQLPYVRRSTGGAALVHDREVTYSLALPAGTPWQTHRVSWVCRMHTILRDVFAGFGVTTRLVEEERKRHDVLCFLHETPGDLLLGEAKIVGSAQRKMRGALLQHGGILLAQSRHTPALPGVAELTGVTIAMPAFLEALHDQLGRATGWRLEAAAWTEMERRRIEQIAAEKYAATKWNDKR